MKEENVRNAICAARKGISQYLWLIESLHKLDVSEDREFQKRYNAFYRVRQRSQEWYSVYYDLLETQKIIRGGFDQVLDRIWERTGRYEPSFSSKLVATVDPTRPVWDRFVLENTGLRAPSYTSRSKKAEAKIVYRQICDWYSDFLVSPDAKEIAKIFRDEIPEHELISDLKKVDFFLWQTRA